MLWVLEQPCYKQLRGFGLLRNECFPSKHEKQSLLYATNFVRWVGIGSRNTGHRQRGWFSLQEVQRLGEFSASTSIDGVRLELVDAKFLVPVVNLLTIQNWLLSSVLSFPEANFVLSCSSASSFNQSLNSSDVGRSQFFMVCIDRGSFKFGGSFCVAWLKSDALILMVVQLSKNSFQSRHCRGISNHTFAAMLFQRQEIAEFCPS